VAASVLTGEFIQKSARNGWARNHFRVDLNERGIR
jgi:hypothetical protein